MKPLPAASPLPNVQAPADLTPPAPAAADPQAVQAFEQLMSGAPADAAATEATAFNQKFEHGMQMWAIQVVQPRLNDRIKELRETFGT